MKYCKWCPYNDPKEPADGVCQDYVDCPINEKFWDYKDAAKFEARVTRELLREPSGYDSLCSYLGNEDEPLCSVDCGHELRSCLDNRLLWARLRAEEQMES